MINYLPILIDSIWILFISVIGMFFEHLHCSYLALAQPYNLTKNR